MTCTGFEVLGCGHAIAWANVEVYSNGAPDGRHCKLSINAMAGAIGIGSGRLGVLRHLQELTISGTSFDRIAALVPGALSTAASDFEAAQAFAPGPTGAALIGWSEKFGRIVGATFQSSSNFAVIAPVRSWRSPAVTGSIDSVDDIPIIADRQLDAIRAEIPGATGGCLVIAELRGARITTKLYSFQTGGPLDRPSADNSASVRKNPERRRAFSVSEAAVGKIPLR